MRPGAGRILFFHAGFNPRTPCGVRQVASGKGFPFLRFNPRTPCGVRRVTFQHTAETRPFQSTHSLRSATSIRSRLLSLCVVSIHALLAECDQIRVQDIPGIRPFQSTHSLRSATIRNPDCINVPCGFNPRTPCGVRPIHPSSTLRATLFQSTHSLRSATGGKWLFALSTEVSIHALLAECDCISVQDKRQDAGFNPRTPCGVRRNRLYTLLLNRANHTLRQPP